MSDSKFDITKLSEKQFTDYWDQLVREHSEISVKVAECEREFLRREALRRTN